MLLFQCTRQNEKYRNFHVRIGDLYGRDDTSPFVWQLEYAKETKSGLHATLRLWRLDMQSTRNWYEVWEQNDTTIALVRMVNMLGKSQRMRAIIRYGQSNRCAEIPRKHLHTRIYK